MSDDQYNEPCDMFDVVAAVLKANDGLCLDGAEEREAVASAIVDALDEAEMLRVSRAAI